MHIEAFLMTHATKGIVLRTLPYGETSVIVTIFTELFGIQTYLINSVRKKSSKGTKMIMLQPGAILDMQVYHNELKNLQRIKDCQWSVLCNRLFEDVVKNSVLLYMMELLHKTLKQPEPNPPLFQFCEDGLMYLDKCNQTNTANFALYFSLQLPQFFGFKIGNPLSEIINHDCIYLDLQEGRFGEQKPNHPHFIEGPLATYTNELLKVIHPEELNQIPLNKETRRNLLSAYLHYFSLHLPDFGKMNTLKIMQEVLS